MKILALSDEECPALWDYYLPGRLDGIDLIISCGDLKASYLSFLVTMARVPVLYVHGNHDTDYQYNPPWGCDCIDDAIQATMSITIEAGCAITGTCGGDALNCPGTINANHALKDLSLHLNDGESIAVADELVRKYGLKLVKNPKIVKLD